MKFVKFEQKHVKQLKELSDTLFNDGWNESQFECELYNSQSKVLLLEEKDKIIGFIFSRVNFDEVEILNIGIQKEYQRKNFGRLLLQQILTECEDMFVTKAFLEVREDNLPAVNLYKSMGFTENRRRKKYYGNCDGLELIKLL